MKPLLVMVLIAAIAPPAQAAPAAQIQLRTRVFEAAVVATPQSATVDCRPGEHATGGGYSLRGQELRVTGSYPAGSSWVIEVVNTAKVPAVLSLSAACLAGVTADQVATVSVGTDRAACPSGAQVAGGGYQTRAAGSVIDSHPGLGDSWVADGPAVTRVFAVCVRGAEAGRSVTARLSALAGSPACAQEPVSVSACSWPRAGAQELSCADGELLTMGGQRVVAGTMPSFAVPVANTDGLVWTFRLAGSSRTAGPLTIEVSAVCLRFPADAVAVPSQPVDLSWPVVGGAALLLLLLLLVAAVAVVRHLRRRPTAAQTAQLDIVLVGQRTTLHHDAYREVL